MSIDHALFGRDALQCVEFATQFGACCGGLVALLRFRQYLSDAPDIVDEGLLHGPFGFQAREFVLEQIAFRHRAGTDAVSFVRKIDVW
jgi:hypothetical protein